jgi:DnaK suppressor protein
MRTRTVTPKRSDTRRDELKRALQARRLAIDTSIRERMSSLREERAAAGHVVAPDDGEVWDVDVHEDVELALVQMKRETVKRIDDALARLEANEYGRCLECGDEIAAARLRALPFAVRCVSCEDAREAEDRRRDRRRRRVEHGHQLLNGLDARLR